MPTSTINRTIFWNRRRVGDLGGRVGINQDLKRLVMYSVEPTAKNIYIMNYSGGQYSKPTVPLVVLDNSQDWDVSYTEINDVLLINCSNENQARLFITFDDYAFEVKYPDLAPVEIEVIPSEISEGQAGLDPNTPKGEVKGIVCEVDKYVGIMYAIRLTDGSHVMHSLPFFQKLDIGSPGSGNVIVNKLSFEIDRDYMVINNLYKKVIDGVSIFITRPYKNIQETIASGVYYKVGSWDVDYIIGETPIGSTVLMEFSEEQITSFEVLEIDPFSHHSLAGRYTQNYNEILMLGGVFTNFGFPPKYKPLNGTIPLSELGLNGVYDLVTIKVGNSEYFRIRKNTYYQGTDNTKIVIQKFVSYPDRRATRQRSYYYNPGDGDYELIADIPLKPHPALNLAYSYVDVSTATLGNVKDLIQSINGAKANIKWVDPTDTITIPATGIYTIRFTLIITSSSTFTITDEVFYTINGGSSVSVAGISAPGTYELTITGLALNKADIIRIEYEEKNSVDVNINVGSFYALDGNVTIVEETQEFTIGGQYLIPKKDNTDYILSGETITVSSLDFTVNNQNLVELNKLRVSDALVVKFPIERTYELGDNSQNNEIVSILVNTNDISQGQFGQFPIYVFSRNRIYGLEISQSPDVLFSRIITIFSDFGLQNRDAAVPFNGSVIFISPRGIHTLSGSKVEDIHFPIQDHWLYSFLVGTPAVPVQNSKLALNHKRNELYFFNEEMDSAFCYSLQYGVWFTFNHITGVQHVMYDEQFPYLVCPDKIYNMEDLSSDKVEIKIITNAYKLGDKRVYKKVKHNYLRGNLYRDDTDEFFLKLRAARGISRLVDLATYNLQNTGKEELSDAILRNHWGSYNFFALELRGQLFPSSRIISWDIDFETRYDHRLRSARLLPDLPETPINLVASIVADRARATWTNVAINATNIEVWLKIEERTGPDEYEDFQAYTRVALLGPGATTYTYPTLPVQGRYTYKVRAINGIAQSDFSNEDDVTIFWATVVLLDVIFDNYSIEITWDEISDNTLPFILERSPNGTDSWMVVDDAIPADQFTYTDNPY